MRSTKPPSDALAARIRKERKLLGLTQAELARLAGCGPIFVHKVEMGKPSVRLDKVLDVLSVLGLSLTIAHGKPVLQVRD
jgi:HTH-type transcriptional regulator/antitoxin HipB